MVIQSTKHALVMTAISGDPVSSPTDSNPSKSAQRVPAPESPQAIQTRFRVIAAFWSVIIFLGFPIWWQTTSIYRAHLPIQEMVDWADGKVINNTACRQLTRLTILTHFLPSRPVARFIPLRFI